MCNCVITGSNIESGELVYKPPRNGPTLWEIGILDRSAAQFYIPDPNPEYVNKLFVNHHDKKKDHNTYAGSTRQIKFYLDNVDGTQTYELRIALAAVHMSELQVRINEPEAKIPIFTSGVIGKDNTIARHGIHGLYWLYNIDIPGSQLVAGNNTIFLTITKYSTSPFQGIKLPDLARPMFARPLLGHGLGQQV
ncbi:Peptidase S15, X-Pro dipeptidyl-peptidase [Parasponia andersonii]|uniref:Peptidase S15, X-Pro dipeptidyl-peptidase n=1 Tax=Parasponia andersonii TaxID=3476 RepID=A0A2P5CF28_PARAD|nr:Peptidase S15, X-Pro dipeptidyl-peptidase [Parasponia andersonii]